MLEHDRTDVSKGIDLTKSVAYVSVLFIIIGTFLTKISELIQKYVMIVMI